MPHVARPRPHPLPNDAALNAGAITVALAQPFAPDAVVLVRIGATAIAIFDVRGALHAIDDACMRCGASLMEARRDEARLECRCGWGYDVVTGAVEGVPALRLDKFDVTRVGDTIRVGAPAR